MLHELMSSAMAPSECHGSNCWWGNGIFTPSSNREGEVDSIPLKQREEQRQAFSKEEVAGNMLNNKWDNGIFTPSFNREGEVASIPPLCIFRQAFNKEEGAGNQGGTDNLMSRGNVRQVHPAAKWDSVSDQVPHSQQPFKCCQQVRPGECHEQVVGQTKVAIQAAPLLQKTVISEQDQNPIDSQVSTGKVQLRMGYNNILLSLLSLMDVQQASKSMEVVTKPVDTAQSLPQPPLQEQGRQDLTAIEDHQSPPHVQGPEDLRPLHDEA